MEIELSENSPKVEQHPPKGCFYKAAPLLVLSQNSIRSPQKPLPSDRLGLSEHLPARHQRRGCQSRGPGQARTCEDATERRNTLTKSQVIATELLSIRCTEMTAASGLTENESWTSSTSRPAL